MITADQRALLDTIRTAARADDLCLIACQRRSTGEPIAVLATVSDDGLDYLIVPVAVLVDDLTFADLVPPDGGTHGS